MTSADYVLQASKGIKMSFDNGIKANLKKYIDQQAIKFYETAEISEIFTSTESMDGAEELGELTTPPSLKLEDGYSVTISEKRFGGAIIVPEKVYRRDGRDSTLKVDTFLMRQRDKLMKTNVNLLLTRAFQMYNEAFDNQSDYLSPDSVEICGSHSWSSGGTFDNGVTNGLDSDEIDTAWEYAGNFTDPAGITMPLNWDCIIVKKGSANEREAIRLFAKEIKPTAVNDINIYEGTMMIISTPYITYTNRNYWFLLDKMQDHPLGVGVGEYPTMREPIKLENEAIRTNVTGFWKQGVVNMPFALYGSDGTT